jgi:hypothetical protein
VYIGVSGGHKLAIGGTLIRLQTLLKGDFIKPAWKKRQMSFLKKGAKIHLKNRRLYKSTQTRAPTIEILPVLSPNKLVGITRTFSGRDKWAKKIAKGNTCNVEILQLERRAAVHGPSISPAKCHQEVMDHKQAGAEDTNRGLGKPANAKIMLKCTSQKRSQNGSKTAIEIEKVP